MRISHRNKVNTKRRGYLNPLERKIRRDDKRDVVKLRFWRRRKARFDELRRTRNVPNSDAVCIIGTPRMGKSSVEMMGGDILRGTMYRIGEHGQPHELPPTGDDHGNGIALAATKAIEVFEVKQKTAWQRFVEATRRWAGLDKAS